MRVSDGALQERFKAHFRRVMDEQELTQRVCAKALDWRETTLSIWLTDLRPVKVPHQVLLKFSEVYKVPLSDLYKKDPHPRYFTQPRRIYA